MGYAHNNIKMGSVLEIHIVIKLEGSVGLVNTICKKHTNRRKKYEFFIYN